MAMTQKYMRRLNEEIGIAPANSQEEYQAAQVISSIMEEYDVEPAIEEFDTRAFSGLVPSIVSLLVLVGVFLGGLGAGFVSVVGVLLALVPAIVAALRMLGRDVSPSFGPRVRSQNVVGLHRACGPNVTKGSRTIVVVAHYDTPHENPLYSSALAPYLATLARTGRTCALVTSLCAFVQLFGFIPAPARIFLWVVGIVCALPSVVPAVGAIAERLSPCTLGANDNKAAVAAMLGVLERVRPRHASEDVPSDDGLGFEIDEVTDGEGLGVDVAAAGQEEVASEPDVAAFSAPLEDAGAEGLEQAEEEDGTAVAAAEPRIEEKVVMREEREEVVGVRHGAEVLSSLGILPEYCVVEYVAPAVRMVPVRVSVPVEPIADLTMPVSRPSFEEGQYEEPSGHEIVPSRRSGGAPWQAVLDKIKEFIASRPWEGLVALVAQLKEKVMAARAQKRPAEGDVPVSAPDAAQTSADEVTPEGQEAPAEQEDDVQPTAPTAPLATAEGSVVSDAEPAATTTGPEGSTAEGTVAGPSSEKTAFIPHLSLVMDDDPRGVGPKDSSGLVVSEDSFDVEATNPNVSVRPEPPADPEWGKSSYRPQLSSVARRATLFDLPDPSTAERDPFGSTGSQPRTPSAAPATAPVVPSSQRPASSPELGQAVAPAPVSTMANDDESSRQKRARLSSFLDRLKKSDGDGDGRGSGWLGDGDDDSTWRGGAAMREGLRLVEGDEGQPSEEDLRDAVLSLGDDDLIAHDIWFVALGASAFDHAGMKAFLAQHRSDIRGSFVVNLDCIGAGSLTVLSHEGLEGTRRADRRLSRLITGVANDLHVPIAQKKFDWTSTDATPAMRASRRAVTIMGLNESDLPALSRTSLDIPENVSGKQAADVSQIVTEMIRRS